MCPVGIGPGDDGCVHPCGSCSLEHAGDLLDGCPCRRDIIHDAEDAAGRVRPAPDPEDPPYIPSPLLRCQTHLAPPLAAFVEQREHREVQPFAEFLRQGGRRTEAVAQTRAPAHGYGNDGIQFHRPGLGLYRHGEIGAHRPIQVLVTGKLVLADEPLQQSVVFAYPAKTIGGQPLFQALRAAVGRPDLLVAGQPAARAGAFLGGPAHGQRALRAPRALANRQPGPAPATTAREQQIGNSSRRLSQPSHGPIFCPPAGARNIVGSRGIPPVRFSRFN